MPLIKFLSLSSLRVPLLLAMAIGLALALSASPPSATADVGSGPSAFCHVTDGTFTDCDPATSGNEEWSDIAPTIQPETGGVVYADQADLIDNSKIADFEAGSITSAELFVPDGELDHLMLMYEGARTEPLGPDEYVLVHFMTVDEKGANPDALLHYVVRIYSDGTIQVFVDGEERGPGGRQQQIDTMRGAVGFGSSPNNPTPHVLSEFQIGLAVAGFSVCCYSPDPAWWSSTTPPEPEDCQEFTSTSVVISFLNNVNITPETARAGLQEAQSIFNDAGVNVEFLVADVRTGVTGGDFGGDGEVGSGFFGFLEELTVVHSGNQAVKQLPDKKGINVTFAKTLNGGSLAGYTYHEWPSTVVIDDNGTATEIAQVIAHEISHVLTLGSHAVDDPNNLMFPTATSTATQLNADQVAEIQKRLPKRGRTIEKCSAGEPLAVQLGTTADDLGDVATGSPKYLDIIEVELSAIEGEENLELLLAVGGVFPAAGPVNVSYRLLFDTDNNAGTGSLIDGLPGIEKEVRIDVVGDQSLGPLTISGSVIDHGAGTAGPLPATPVVSEEAALDTDSEPVVEQFFGVIPRALLGLAADDVPVTVIAEDTSGVADTASFVFDQKAFEKIPTLTLTVESAALGQLVDFAINGLTSGETFDLRLGDELVLTETVGGDGSFNGGFVFPSLPPGDYFLIAQDATGAFAFNVIEALPVGVVNGGFETCTLEGWDIAPGSVASAITSLGPAGPFTPILPVEGECMAFLSTAGFAPTPPGTLGSVISQTFVVPEAAFRFEFCYQYVSNDSSSFENFFLAELDTQLGTFTLGSADNAGGSPAGGFVPPPPPTISPGVTLTPDPAPIFLSGVNILGSGLFIIPSSLMTDRVCSSVENIPTEIRGTAVTLRFIAGDALDTVFDSAVVIDAITFGFPADADGDGVPDAEDNCPTVANQDQQDADFNGIGDACEETTALDTTAFLQANLDGTTGGEATDPAAGEPPLDEQVTRIVQFQIDEGLTDDFEQLTANLVGSQVDLGLVPPEEEEQVVNVVLQQVDQDSDGVPDGEDACPATPGLAERQGCPVGDENVVDLHVVDQAKTGACPDGAGSCKSPIEGAEVRVFDRNDADFQAQYGTKNPSGAIYDQVFENDIGRVGACTTGSDGRCIAGEETTGDYLVIVKYVDAETGRSVYTGKPKSPEDFVDTDGDTQGDLASKDFQVIKVFERNDTVQFSGGSKTVVSGSYLEVVSPDFAVWEDVAAGYVYPFIFISDSDWEVDLCTRVPHGYAIVGVYDENGDLMSDSRCTQTFVSGETKVIAYEVEDVGSPEPRLNARLTVTHHGRVTLIDLDVPGIRIAEEHAPGGPLAFGVAGASLTPLLGLAYLGVTRRRRQHQPAD